MNYSWETADAFRTCFGTLVETKGISGTPLNLNFWRTSIELLRIRSMGCMSVFAFLDFHKFNLFTFSEEGKKLNASEGNEPRKASSPLPFREAINNFVGNLSAKGQQYLMIKKQWQKLLIFTIHLTKYNKMRWIQSSNLVQLADEKDCEGILPELIRKLIISSCPSCPELTVPIGSSIYKPGWDGQCFTDSKYGFVPKGTSLWEFGRDKDYKRKCDREYNKRSQQTNEIDRLNSTFVFITPRRWITPLKTKWIEAKKETNEWKDLKIYDADDLELWLEQQPVVAHWLARKLNLFTNHVESALEYWQRFISNETFVFTPELLISGREFEKSQIQKIIFDFGQSTEIQSSSISESICFFIASAISVDNSTSEKFFTKALVVSNKEDLKEILSIHNELIIIYDSNENDALNNFDAKSNLLIKPVTFEVKCRGINIPIPKWESFTESLKSIGIERTKAEALSRQCGRSFSVLKRILSNAPGRVGWNSGNDCMELIPIFLIQKFDDAVQGDKDVIEKFSRCDYGIYKEKLKRWSVINDAPIYQVANHWRIVSSYDLMHVLAKYITEEHLRQFENVVFEMLGETDPALDLEPNMRYAAALFDKKRKFSSRLRDGISHSLLLLAVYGESSGINVNIDIQAWTDKIVRRLLSRNEISFWQSVENKLVVLAEASPESFFTSFENSIKKSPEIFTELFDDKEYSLFSPSYHTHILWALELLAWNPTYLSRVVIILAKLFKLDKGSALSNRPINSLRSIFLNWLPQTYADLKSRQEVIETLIMKEPEVAFELLKLLVPKTQDTGHYNQKPIYRMRDLNNLVISRKEVYENSGFVQKKLIELAKNDASKWAEIIDFINNFYGERRLIMINTLTGIAEFEGEIDLLRDALREFIQRHEMYSNQKWALKGEELTLLKDFFPSLVTTTIDKYYWYFNVDYIEKSSHHSLSHDERIELLESKRQDAVNAVFNEYGINGILELVSRTTKSWEIGYHLADVMDNIDDDIFHLFLSEEGKPYSMTMGYINRKSDLKGSDWIFEKLAFSLISRSTQKISEFFLSINPSSSLWNILNDQLPEVQDHYWQNIFKSPYGYRLRGDDLQLGIKTLNKYNRYLTSLKLIRYERKNIPPELIIEILEGIATGIHTEELKIDNGAWHISELFKRLDKEAIDEKKMQLLEWYYLPILNGSHSDRPIKYLFKYIENDPSFFAELISWIYIPENKNPKEEMVKIGKEDIASRAKNAHELIESWCILPGMNDSEEINSEYLLNWIYSAIGECKKRDREKRGFYEIGKLLGRLSVCCKHWPHPELCEIIEKLDQEEINKGFVLGVINGKGTEAHIRPVSNGSPERVTAQKYRNLSQGICHQFPIVSSLLNEVASHYESWGRHLDIDETQRELEY
ncbi:hypothetical protein [Sunxiuqinia indica]|uniref:hypothetical protein n=1 Tax=Sunxiuqinia indica TaxID=2692584 RepID=UPI001358EB27|nr:hypothetical protein [Sunxiuqinia indica]